MSFSKPNPLYLINRSSKNPNILSKTTGSIDKFISVPKREKLKSLLIVKFMKKYGLQKAESLLEEEVTKFLKGEKLTDSGLQKFDNKLKSLLDSNKNQDNLMKNLTKSCNLEDIQPKLPDINNDIMSVRSHKSTHSKMSGYSKLSQFHEEKKTFQLKPKVDDDNISAASIDSKANRPKPILNFAGDNWDLIAKYNQKKFEEEKRDNKIKDKEIKRRIKDDLDLQMREKLLRSSEELKKNREFDVVVLKHIENMNRLEREKEQEIKNKFLQEKISRDIQLKDEVKRKKVEVVKNKKFEKEIGSIIILKIN